ncbi:MAG: DNA alkylation repair protein [Solobacterium sp.]|nr:DNA alkylation repair protein [Solobacterium sp.]
MENGSLKDRIRALQDPKNAAFLARLCPDTDAERILGARVPQLRKLAVQAEKEGIVPAFLAELPHEYHEENVMHAILISRIRDAEQCIAELQRFLPFADNWAVTDAIRPAVMKSHTALLEPYLNQWMCSSHPFTVRTAIGLYMAYYLEDGFRIEQAEQIASMRSDHYYVNMMRAWYFATALAKQPEAVLPLLQGSRIDRFTRLKAIQKSLESYRIDDAMKSELRRLKQEVHPL